MKTFIKLCTSAISEQQQGKKKRAASVVTENVKGGYLTNQCFVWVLPSNNLGHNHKVHGNRTEEILSDVMEEGVLVVEILSYMS